MLTRSQLRFGLDVVQKRFGKGRGFQQGERVAGGWWLRGVQVCKGV